MGGYGIREMGSKHRAYLGFGLIEAIPSFLTCFSDRISGECAELRQVYGSPDVGSRMGLRGRAAVARGRRAAAWFRRAD